MEIAQAAACLQWSESRCPRLIEFTVNRAERLMDSNNTPKTKLFGTIVVAALIIAIILLALGVVKFGPFG